MKYKQMIALGVAITTQCAYYIEIHAKRALGAGVSDREMAERVAVTASLRAGGAIMYGARIFTVRNG